MHATDLTCEYSTDGFGIDTPTPRLGWVLRSQQRAQKQSAYRIRVASSPERLTSGQADLWDTGRVDSERSFNIPYEGQPLSGGQRCWWQVHLWPQAEGVDDDGNWSDIAWFETALLCPSDWHGAWISAAAEISSPLLRKDLHLPAAVVRARAYVCGLGWSEFYLNGSKVGDRVLDPATSEYADRVYYAVFDVTDHLVAGNNAAGLMLGNGWWSEPDWQKRVCISEEYYGLKGWQRRSGGTCPQAIVQLNADLADGTRVSLSTDETWTTSPGPILRNDFFNGELYDARLEQPGWSQPGFDDSAWTPATLADEPGGTLTAQIMPPIRITQIRSSARMSEPAPGVYVFDMGQLFGGWPRVRLTGPAGTKVAIRSSARINEQTGTIDVDPNNPHAATDYYILRGDPDGETYQPRFTYHGVQYVQIENAPGPLTIHDVDGCVVHTDEDLSGDFECSDALCNRIHRNVTWTLTNGLYGMPLDCLYREHWAWTDPATITGMLYPYKYMPRYWTKWLRDIADAQRPDGSVPNTAPDYRGDASDPAWGGNYPILAWYLYRYYGDERILTEHYDGMKRCVDYLTSVAEDHLVAVGQFGDHMMPGDRPGTEQFISEETPPPLVWTGYYYRGAVAVAEAAKLLGNTRDARAYAQLAAEIAAAFNAEWFEPATGNYAGGAQTANVFPLALGIVPGGYEQTVVRNLTRSIVEDYHGHHHTGNTGTTCLIDTLTRAGHGDVLWRMATNRDYPGWGYMVEQGATTIWESWSLIAPCGNSESMIMWATIDRFFYCDILGISAPEYYAPRDETTAGFEHIVIAPNTFDGLTHAAGWIRTPRGPVRSSWNRYDPHGRFDVEIPVGSTATLRLPTMGFDAFRVEENAIPIWEDGAVVRQADGVSGITVEGDRVIIEVGSGPYTFRIVRVES